MILKLKIIIIVLLFPVLLYGNSRFPSFSSDDEMVQGIGVYYYMPAVSSYIPIPGNMVALSVSTKNEKNDYSLTFFNVISDKEDYPIKYIKIIKNRESDLNYQDNRHFNHVEMQFFCGYKQTTLTSIVEKIDSDINVYKNGNKLISIQRERDEIIMQGFDGEVFDEYVDTLRKAIINNSYNKDC